MNLSEHKSKARLQAESMWSAYSSGNSIEAVAKAHHVTRQWVYQVFNKHGFKTFGNRERDAETFKRAMELYFEIEKHFALGGNPLSVKEVSQMLQVASTSSAHYYLNILRRWKLVHYQPRRGRTIHLIPKPNYPPVEWRKTE